MNIAQIAFRRVNTAASAPRLIRFSLNAPKCVSFPSNSMCWQFEIWTLLNQLRFKSAFWLLIHTQIPVQLVNPCSLDLADFSLGTWKWFAELPAYAFISFSIVINKVNACVHLHGVVEGYNIISKEVYIHILKLWTIFHSFNQSTIFSSVIIKLWSIVNWMDASFCWEWWSRIRNDTSYDTFSTYLWSGVFDDLYNV